MDIISNSYYDVRAKYGHLILVCLEADEEKTQKLRHELSKAGYAYVYFPISRETFARRDYLSEIIKALDTCSCFIPVITDKLFDEDHAICRNIFWFAAGYIQTKCAGGIVPFLADGDGSLVSSTPLKNANLLNKAEDVVKTLESKYANRLMKSQYYDNYLLNYYAYNRIIYRRIALKCRIYEKDFQRICEAMEYEWGSSAEVKLDRFLANNLVCAYKVLSFGCDNAIEPQLEPYKEEIHPSENGLASSVICESEYTVLDDDERDETGVHAELEIRAVVPVHKLFGVYFKNYISLRQSDYFWIIPMLFARDLGRCNLSDDITEDEMEDPSYWKTVLPKGAHADFRKSRLYYSLGFERHNEEKSIALTPEMGVGATADYIFPQ
jgi:hypothetical protein